MAGRGTRKRARAEPRSTPSGSGAKRASTASKAGGTPSSRPDSAGPRSQLLNPSGDSAFACVTPGTFNSARPFRHVVCRDFLDVEFARGLREELITKLDAPSKETDLFKFHQTGDVSAILARLKCGRGARKNAGKKLPFLQELVDTIYAKEFRNELATKFGLGAQEELCERVDMAVQAYTEGDHLMCHDDVISTRKITFVLYLDRDESPWDLAREGGAMELYDGAELHVGREPPASSADPACAAGTAALTIPASEVAPDFNTALFFGVEPGRSYHAVREVRTPDRVRLSLQGWFHVETRARGAGLRVARSWADTGRTPGGRRCVGCCWANDKDANSDPKKNMGSASNKSLDMI